MGLGDLHVESRLTIVFAGTFNVGLTLGVGELFGGEAGRESAGAHGCEYDGVEMHGGCGRCFCLMDMRKQEKKREEKRFFLYGMDGTA